MESRTSGCDRADPALSEAATIMDHLTDSTWRYRDRIPYPELRAPLAAARRLRRGSWW
ncbi:hypothetical protein GCM10011579_023480 [Streptomyces albiflavescens]|uniref:Uncharacterized protein n=1 Tax=Streptomyces albiflavescens TaxID=1623582 RepID=A0A917XYB2_9ACTN|nr:hypothetical protein GCM10011579_023480 [Streptomyces albiflavescens]